MSPNVTNFVTDLVAMAKAMELVPQLEKQVESLHDDNDTLSKSLMAREEAILRYKSEIEELHAKVRSLEVERDDASFRGMEIEDKVATALRALRTAKFAMDGAVEVLDPPKPEPQPEPIPEVVHSIEPMQGQSEVGPTVGKMADATLHDAAELPKDASGQSAAGQSEPLPTAASETTQSQVVPSMNAESGESVSATPASEPSGDPEPMKYLPGESYISARWWDWYDRQSQDFKQTYDLL